MGSAISTPTFQAKANNIQGSTTGVAPAAGYLGEVFPATSSLKRSTATTLTSLTAVTVAEMTLGKGTWVIYCSGGVVCTSDSAYKYVALAVSGTDDTMPAADTESFPTNGEVMQIHSTASNSIATNYSVDLTCPPVPLTISGNVTFRAVILCEFTGGEMKGFGTMNAIRMG